MAKNAKPEPDNPAQSKRFVETAKSLESDESGNAFARAFKKIIPSSRKVKKKRGN